MQDSRVRGCRVYFLSGEGGEKREKKLGKGVDNFFDKGYTLIYPSKREGEVDWRE